MINLKVIVIMLIIGLISCAEDIEYHRCLDSCKYDACYYE